MKHSNPSIILIVDADPDARRLLRSGLSSGDYCLLEVATAGLGLVQVKAIQPALILTELDLPDMDGIEFIRQICSKRNRCPVLVVSASSGQNSIIDALDAGADTFILKPFSPGELGARVRVALRHQTLNPDTTSEKTFRVGELEVDFDRRRVRVSGREVHLTQIEYRILSILIVNCDHVVTYKQFLHEVWKAKSRRNAQHLRVHVSSLRKKGGVPSSQVAPFAY